MLRPYTEEYERPVLQHFRKISQTQKFWLSRAVHKFGATGISAQLLFHLLLRDKLTSVYHSLARKWTITPQKVTAPWHTLLRITSKNGIKVVSLSTLHQA